MAAGWRTTHGDARADLARGAVVVAALRLDDPSGQARWARLLDADERDRASRHASDALRSRYVAAHGQLREWLGACTGRPPAALAFTRGAHGKPALVDAAGLHFSLSRAGGHALCALAHARRVGVDLEPLAPGRAGADPLALAASTASVEELAALRRLPATAVADAVIGWWTRKEAFVKAVGAGLTMPLDAFAVSVPPEAPRLLRAPPGEVSAWTFADVADLPGHATALVVEGGAVEVVALAAPPG